MNKDIQHLNLLSVFHHIVGGCLLVFASIPIFHFVLGLMMVFSPTSLGRGPAPPPMVGWLLAVFGGLAVLLGWSLGIAILIAGWFLHRRTHHLYCFIMACFSLMFQPFGTVLGVFTILVLMRPSVKQLFATGEVPYDPEEDELDGLGDERIASDSYNIHDER